MSSVSEVPSPWHLSVVVPVYNSAESLPTLIERLCPVLERHCAQYEMILVNDGSQDESWSAIEAICQRVPFVRGIDLLRNYGQHNALLAGIRQARFPVIITIDDDLQHPPEEIPKLLAKLAEGYDVVYGTPQKEQHGLWRDLASRIIKFALHSATGVETTRNLSAFRAFRTRVREAFANYHGPYVSLDVLLTWGANCFAAIPVCHVPRQSGASNYTFRKLLTLAFTIMTGFGIWPLQFASLIGFAFTLFGLIVLVYVVGRYLLHGGSVPGFPFLASIIAIFSGVQLFALGIIGEYLARMHLRTMGRPTYMVRATTFQG